MFKVKLHPFYNMDGAIGAESGVEEVSAAETQEVTDETGVETQAAAEPDKQNNFEKAFAKRLAAKEAEWEAKNAEKYKDYEVHKELSAYFQQVNNMDAMTLKERIELERLQERAEQQNVPPEVMKRLDELEAKAAKGDALEQLQQEQKVYQEFRTNLEKFATEKGANADELHTFMHEKGIGNMEVAFDAMEAVKLREQLQDAEKNGMKKLLQAKGSIPTVNGKASQGQVVTAAPKTFAEARARAMQRMSQE